MELELTTGNLRKLCRFCLNDGIYNLWEHKFCWRENDTESHLDMPPATATIDEEATQHTALEEITVHEALKMYQGWQHKILTFDTELELICNVCLAELLPCYRFYRRLCAANKQIQQLYQEALQQETHLKSVKCEGSTYVPHDLQEFIEINPVPPSSTKVETVYINAASPTKLHQQPHRRKLVKNAKLVLTGGVTQLLTHAKDINNLPTITEVSLKRAASAQNSSQKRQRKLNSCEELYKELNTVPEYTQYELTTEQTSSNVTAPELKSDIKLSNIVEEQNSTSADADVNATAVNKTSHFADTLSASMDDMPVIATASITPTPEDKILPQDVEELAVLPFSTLSADDAGRTIYVCKYCPRAFTAPCFLITHAHKSHVCKHCAQAYVKSQDLFAHIKLVHQHHECVICKKEFSTNSNLRAHTRRIHQKNVQLTKEPLPQLEFSGSTIDGGGEGVQVMDNTVLAAEYLD